MFFDFKNKLKQNNNKSSEVAMCTTCKHQYRNVFHYINNQKNKFSFLIEKLKHK